MVKETAVEALKDRRKKTTLKKIERKHAGRVQEPYAILERLLEEVEAFAPLRDARFVIMWRRGWRADKDRILCRAKISKSSEEEREKCNDCDWTLKLNRELWALKSYPSESREMDIFEELCRASAVLDEETREQLKDESDRLMWRMRKPPIQTFPEVIERYGLDKSIGINADALKALDDEQAKRDAEAEANDAERPIIQQEEGRAKGGDGWKKIHVAALVAHHKFPKRCLKPLTEKGIETAAELQTLMNEHGVWWWKEVPKLGEETAGQVNVAFGKFLSAQSA